MVEECVHILPDGRKCRRIPKRGQKLCPAHRSRRRPRAPFEEDQAFVQEMTAFIRSLKTIQTADLLYGTVGFLGDLQPLIERRLSRRHRVTFHRASVALSVSADRLVHLARGMYPPAAPRTQPQQPAGAVYPPLRPEDRARFQRIESLLNSGRALTPEELCSVSEEMVRTLKSY